MILRLLLATLVCSTHLLVLMNSAQADQFDSVRELIKSTLVDEQIPSVTVAVARHGEIIWEEGFGWADRENRRPATEHTMYSIASISKPITATGIMVLVEQGKLDLDKPANEYLGDAKLVAHVGDASDATLRRLANHTSGLPLHYQFFYADQPYRRPPMDESIRRYGQLVTAPGERYQYANFGYGVMDYVIERTSGMSYAEFMRREVFLPLGMTHTSVDIGPGLEEHQAIRYAPDQTPLPFYDFDHPGASAVFSSAHDLLRFGMFHLKQRGEDQRAILSDATIEQMQKPTAENGPSSGYGIGWSISTADGPTIVSHTGGMGGVRTMLMLVPEEKIVVVALCNFSTQFPIRLSREVLATLLPEHAEKLRSGNNNNGEQNSAFEPPAELLGHWSGHVHTYEGDRPIELWFKESGDIHVRFNGQLKTLLSEPRFTDGSVRGIFAGDIATPDANRRPYHLHLSVKLRGEVLNGSLAAISLPGNRAGNALSHWIEVKKQID